MNSYRIENFAGSIDNEIARLKGQVELFWEKEERCLRMFGMRDGMSILECGCGPGYLIERLLKTFPNSYVTGIEIDNYLVQKCKENLSVFSSDKVCIYEQSILKMDLPDNSFDFAISRMVLEHMPDPLIAVREVHRVLKTGGKAVFIDNDFDFHLRTYPDIPELNELYKAYCTCRIAEGGRPRIGRELPGILLEGGFLNVELEIVSVHSRLVGDKSFLRSEGSGIPAKLVKDGYLSRNVFDRLARKWHSALQENDHSLFRQLFVSVGEKCLFKAVQCKIEPKLKNRRKHCPAVHEIFDARSSLERCKLLTVYLQIQIATFLDAEEERLPFDQTLISIGVDSIMSVELANRFAAEFAITISAVDILDAQSINTLATRLTSELEKEKEMGLAFASKPETQLAVIGEDTSTQKNLRAAKDDSDWEEGYI